MTARDELLAALVAERYAPRPRPLDTLAAVQHVGRVDWATAFLRADTPPAPAATVVDPDEPPPTLDELTASIRAAADAVHAAPYRPEVQVVSERERLRALMPGRTPRETR